MFKPFKPLSLGRPAARPVAAAEPATERPTKRMKLSPLDKHEEVNPVQQTRQPSTMPKPVTTEPDSTSHVSNDAQYTVLFRKFTNKKNKTWDGDGVLTVSQGYASLRDLEGREIGKTACKIPLLPGSTLSVSGKEVEIDSRISMQEVKTMLPKPAAPRQPAVKNVSTKSSTFNAPRPSVPVSRTPLRPTQSQTKTNHRTEAPRVVSDVKNKPTAAAAFKNPLLDKTLIRAKSDSTAPQPRHDPKEPGALVMKRPKHAPGGKHIVDVVVDPMITKNLREHQRAGVAFLYECVMGMRPFEGEGAILADEMGLGKTLQTIALIWTLLKQNPIYEDEPVIKKALIVCPVTLINNWRKEFKKWLGNERIGVMVAENNKTRFKDFTMGKSYNIMIIGYEKLRNVSEELQKGFGVDLVIADEGHRLKTAQNKSAMAIKSLNTERRVILSGTPIQNDLSEFYTMVDFVNPGLLNKYSTFKKEYETPILKSRTPGATAKDVEKGQARSEELASITGQFILRRTSEILSKYLPPKSEYVVYCRPTQVQRQVYEAIIQTGVLNTVIKNSEASLQMINILKKVCNSPALAAKETTESNQEMVKSLIKEVPNIRQPGGSSKLSVLDSLLHTVYQNTNEKVVVVSNYTSTLDMIQKMLTSFEYSYLRLDGSTPATKRQPLVDQFNLGPRSKSFVFLLSAKAGGVGLNLIGASRLVLFDIDWNPATDLQAMGRVHRDGQKHPVHIYRLLTKGALEEKIFQRQLTKQGLADAVVDNKSSVSSFSPDELRDLFTLDQREGCQTHDLLGCDCECGGGTSIVPLSPAPSSTSTVTLLDDADADSDVENEKEDEEKEDEEIELPDFPTFMRTSQVDFAAQDRLKREHQAKLVSAVMAKKGNGGTGNKPMQALMRFSHLDAEKFRKEVGEFVEEGDKEARAVEGIADGVLRELVLMEGSVVDFVFAKCSS